MKRTSCFRVLGILSCFAAALFLCSAASFAQEKADKGKLYAEIAGDYEFDIEGQVTIITFFVEGGVLMGKDSTEDQGTPLDPVEGKELEFEATTDEGQFFEIKFSRDESGKITKCLLATMGAEFEGAKAEK